MAGALVGVAALGVSVGIVASPALEARNSCSQYAETYAEECQKNQNDANKRCRIAFKVYGNQFDGGCAEAYAQLLTCMNTLECSDHAAYIKWIGQQTAESADMDQYCPKARATFEDKCR